MNSLNIQKLNLRYKKNNRTKMLKEFNKLYKIWDKTCFVKITCLVQYVWTRSLIYVRLYVMHEDI